MELTIPSEARTRLVSGSWIRICVVLWVHAQSVWESTWFGRMHVGLSEHVLFQPVYAVSAAEVSLRYQQSRELLVQLPLPPTPLFFILLFCPSLDVACLCEDYYYFFSFAHGQVGFRAGKKALYIPLTCLGGGGVGF